MNDTNKKDDLDAVREVAKALEPFTEDEQLRIIRWSCEKLGIATPNTSTNKISAPEVVGHGQSQEDVEANSESDAPRHITNINSFVAKKNPGSDSHFAAVVAYYHQFEAPEEKRKNTITKNDLVEATRLADYTRLKRPEQTLVNAKNAGLLDSTSEGGHYTLNSVGENLVAMILPDTTSQKQKIKKRKVKSKATRKKVVKKVPKVKK